MHEKDIASIIVIPTNGTVKKNGLVVMGRGLAADALRKYPIIEYELGRLLSRKGNQVYFFWKWRLITFSVKHEWHQKADVLLIAQSAKELKLMIGHEGFKRVFVPRVGCGNGGLLWKKVKPILESELDHCTTFVTWDKEV